MSVPPCSHQSKSAYPLSAILSNHSVSQGKTHPKESPPTPPSSNLYAFQSPSILSRISNHQRPPHFWRIIRRQLHHPSNGTQRRRIGGYTLTLQTCPYEMNRGQTRVACGRKVGGERRESGGRRSGRRVVELEIETHEVANGFVVMCKV